jgi:hypothetical protein
MTVYSDPELAALDLGEGPEYAVSLRYDIEFWQEKATAEGAVALSKRVLEIIRVGNV